MILNNKQRKIVIIGVVLFVLMGLFLPWKHTLDYESIRWERPAGYAFIALPPEPEGAIGARIDISRLIVQWLILAAASSLGMFMTRTQEKE